MKTIILFLHFLSPNWANSQWVESPEIIANTKSQKEVRSVIEKYQIDLKKEDKIIDLQYHAKIFIWKGPSSCQQGDPRLTYKTEDFELTSVAQDGSIFKSASNSARLADSDPCYIPANDGKWILVSRNLQEYRSEREIEDYLQKNKENFPDTEAKEVEFASEDVRAYRWQGISHCKPDDPRLLSQIDLGEVRFKDSNPSHGIPSFDPMSTVDPCRH
jgi:hypothetical protein